MGPPVVAQLDHPVADRDRRAIAERPLGRIDLDLAQVTGQLRELDDQVVDRPATLGREALGRADVTPDPGGPEDAVPEAVVEVPVRVDDDRDRIAGELPDVRDDLARLGRRRPRVDDEHVASAEDDADLLVEERIPAREDAIADLDPLHEPDGRSEAGGVDRTPATFGSCSPSDEWPSVRR